MRQLRKLTDTPSEQFLLETALSHLRVTNGAEIPLVLQYLSAAREVVERLTGRALLTQTYELAQDKWTDSLILDRSPVSSVSSILYLNEDGVSMTVSPSDYVLVRPEDASAFVVFRSTFMRPSLYETPLAVTVNFTAGNANWSLVPYSQRQAILFLAAHLYELRTPINVGNIVNDIPMTLSNLITLNRIGGFIG